LAILRRDIARGYTDPGHAERSIDLYLRPFGDAAGHAAIVAHIDALSHDGMSDLTGRLASISVPTSLIWGQQDRVVPVSVGRRLQAAIPGATLDVIAGARHFTPEESPRRIADVIAVLLERS
jgi:pimeloyl-ACP methyl ester carboxylesterase